MEPESAILGPQGGRKETLAPGRLHLEPGIGAHPQGRVGGTEAGAVDARFLVGIGGQAKAHAVVEPVLALAAEGAASSWSKPGVYS